MHTRRCNNLLKNLDSYLILIILSIFFHINPPSIPDIHLALDFKSVSYLLIIYAGYKYGKKWGAIAGFISVLFWILFVLSTNNYVGWKELIFSVGFKEDSLSWHSFLKETRVYYGSFQYLIIFILIGYSSGCLCDKIETFLAKRELTLTDLLPYSSTSYVLNIFKWLENVSKQLFLLQIDPQDKKGYILKRLRKLFVVIITIPIITLYIAFSNKISYRLTDHFTLIFLPASMSAVFMLWLAYKNGPRIGTWLSLSLLFSPLVAQLLRTYFKEIIGSSIRVSNAIAIPSMILTLGVVSWIIGTFSEQLKKEKIQEKLIFTQYNKSSKTLPVIHILLLLLLSLELRFKCDWFYFKYNSIFILSIYISWLSLYYKKNNISNTVFITLIVTCFFSFFHIEKIGSTIFRLHIGNTISLPELFYISSIPYVVKYIKISKFANIQMLINLIMLTLFALYMLFSHDYYVIPIIFITLKNVYSTFLISLFILICFSQIFAYIIWFFHRKESC